MVFSTSWLDWHPAWAVVLHARKTRFNLTADVESEGERSKMTTCIILIFFDSASNVAGAVRNASSVDVLCWPSINKAVQTQAPTHPTDISKDKISTSNSNSTSNSGGGPRDEGEDHHGHQRVTPCTSMWFLLIHKRGNLTMKLEPTSKLSSKPSCPDHTKLSVQFQPWKCWGLCFEIDVGPSFCTLV